MFHGCKPRSVETVSLILSPARWLHAYQNLWRCDSYTISDQIRLHYEEVLIWYERLSSVARFKGSKSRHSICERTKPCRYTQRLRITLHRNQKEKKSTNPTRYARYALRDKVGTSTTLHVSGSSSEWSSHFQGWQYLHKLLGNYKSLRENGTTYYWRNISIGYTNKEAYVSPSHDLPV